MANTPWRRRNITLEVDTALELTEAGTVPDGAPGAGKGKVWVRSDSPNVLMFTDDTGVDTVLGAGGGGELGLPGNVYENLVFYVDPGDRNSYPVTGSVVTDIMGNGTSGTLTTATLADNGFRFNGTSGSISFTKNASIDNLFDGGGTLIVFARPQGLGEASAGIIVGTAPSVGAASAGWTLNVESANQERCTFSFLQNFSGTGSGGRWVAYDQTSKTDPTPLNTYAGARALPLSAYSSIAITYDSASTANDPTFYINGVARTTTLGIQEANTPTGTANADVGQPVTIGNRPADDRTFNGDIGPVLMFDRILTPTEITQVVNVFATRYGTGIMAATAAQQRNGQGIIIKSGDHFWTGGGSNSEMTAGHIAIVAGNTFIDGISSYRGSNVLIRAGGNTGTVGPVRAGDVILRAGDAISTSNTQGGRFIIQGGAGNNSGFADTTSYIAAGDAPITGGNGPQSLAIRPGICTHTSFAGTNGALILRTGATPNGTQPIATGRIYLGTGISTGVGSDPFGTLGNANSDTGPITITTGPGGVSSTVSGAIQISTGNTAAAFSGGPGAISISTGTNSAGNAIVTGAVNISTGNGTGLNGGGGGNINITGGNQTNTGSVIGGCVGGSINITGGNNAATGLTATPGNVTIQAGNGTGTSTPGGNATLRSGNATGTNIGGTLNLLSGNGGATGGGGLVQITAGNGGATSGVGGEVVIQGGNATSGVGGSISLAPGAGSGGGSGLGTVVIGGSCGLQFSERGTMPGAAITGGNGRLWVRNETPNALIFTDDTGVDTKLGSPWPEGIVTENLLFVVDATNPNCDNGASNTVRNMKYGNSNTAVGNYTGNTTFSFGAWEFDGVSGDINFANDAVLDDPFAGGGTIMAWIRPSSDGETDNGRILSKENTGSTGWSLFTAGEDATTGQIDIQFLVRTTGTFWQWRVNDVGQSIDTWSCVILRWDSDNVGTAPRIWINGIEQDVVVVTTGTGTYASDAANNLRIGNRQGDDRTFHGLIGFAGIWDTELDDKTIKRLYSTTRPKFMPEDDEIIDVLEVTSAVQELTLGGLSSENDGYYRLTGRGITTVGATDWSWEPNTISTNQGGGYTYFEGGTVTGGTISSLEFINFYTDGEGANYFRGIFDVYIWPAHTRGGVAMERMYQSQASVNDGTVASGAVAQSFYGLWDDTSTNFTEMTIFASAANGIGAGSKFVLRRYSDRS